MSFKRIFLTVILCSTVLVGIWYTYFNQDISLPSKSEVQKIEVFQNDFRQHAQQLTYVEEPERIAKIYDFINSRKKGWEPLIYKSPAPVAYADFYSSKGLLFRLCLMKSSNFLIRNNDGQYLKSMRNDERSQFITLLGIQSEYLALNLHKADSI